MKKIIFLLTIILFFSCKDEPYKPQGLHMISKEEMVGMIREGRFPVGDNTIIKNEKGEIIPRDSIMKIPNLTEDWTLDMYINDDFELKEMILRRATEEDKKFKQRLQAEVEGQ